MTPRPAPLDPIEVAVGQPLGPGEGGQAARGTAAAPRRRAAEALEACLLACLQHPPCAVSFSGGRDSSALLAMAADLARRHGLDPPVALTLVYPGTAAADEREWQELVLRSLPGIEWQRIAVTDELDIVGDIARSVVARHGLLFPWNAYTMVPLLGHVAGGTLVTGVGGDELMGSVAARPVRTLAERQRPGRGDLAYLARWFGPGSRRWLGQAVVDRLPWVRPEALGAAWAREGAHLRRLGLRWGAALRRWSRARYAAWVRWTMEAIGDGAGVRVASPFLDPGVHAAFADEFGWAGPRSREDALVAVFGDLLPTRLAGRRTKAVFTEAFFGEASREVRRAWDGGGVDRATVDVDALRRAWDARVPDARTGLLLQQVAFAPTGG